MAAGARDGGAHLATSPAAPGEYGNRRGRNSLRDAVLTTTQTAGSRRRMRGGRKLALVMSGLAVAGVVLAALAVGSGARARAKAAPRPNVVFVLADDLA